MVIDLRVDSRITSLVCALLYECFVNLLHGFFGHGYFRGAIAENMGDSEIAVATSCHFVRLRAVWGDSSYLEATSAHRFAPLWCILKTWL